eukprot:1157021-Pelagomonas_calceolata.AAC.9
MEQKVEAAEAEEIRRVADAAAHEAQRAAAEAEFIKEVGLDLTRVPAKAARKLPKPMEGKE